MVDDGDRPGAADPTGEGAALGRRAFLAGVVAAALAAACGGDDGGDGGGDGGAARTPGTEPPASLPPVPDGLPDELFALGVASGDPVADSVILWTRLVADPLAPDGGLPDAPVPVHWQVATDEGFDDVVAEGDAVADPALAHAVHVDPGGLDPDTRYWYRFAVGDRTGPVGRTRTAPADDAAPDRLRFAFASCQNRQDGYWGALAHLADEDVDLVVFLGDYIYEDAPNPGAVRTGETPEPVDLAGYRARYGEYKRDPLLQAAHARVPWIATWDDHEVQNNYAGDVGLVPPGQPPEAFRARRAAAYQAYYEHMPLRVDPPDPAAAADGGALTLHRQVGWGELARFFVLDGRQHRSDQACDAPLDVGTCPEVEDEARTMLGEEQEAWLGEALGASGATWNVVAQQVVLSRIPLPLGSPPSVALDLWDGYPAARRRLVDQLRPVRNPVVITGDIHASGVGVVTADPDDRASPPAVPELVGTSISSDFPPVLVDVVERAAADSPAIRYVNARQRGYVVCEVTPEALTAEFRYVDTVTAAEARIATGARWTVRDGDPEPVEA
ncbi:MAG TPA: alkaline phosphatase D family protein [Acidimicrobiales bacterium]